MCFYAQLDLTMPFLYDPVRTMCTIRPKSDYSWLRSTERVIELGICLGFFATNTHIILRFLDVNIILSLLKRR
jgi:hypothetical protein